VYCQVKQLTADNRKTRYFVQLKSAALPCQLAPPSLVYFLFSLFKTMQCDVAVVGGGVAGLLTAYRILLSKPEWRVLVFEQAPVVGGRLRTGTFDKRDVVSGAGVGRLQKDTRLALLLHELKVVEPAKLAVMVPLPKKPASQMQQQQHQQDLLNKLRQRAKLLTADNDVTFLEFAESTLGRLQARQFVSRMGYTDMLHASARATMRFYGLEDNVSSWTPFAVPWNRLVDALQDAVNQANNNSKQDQKSKQDQSKQDQSKQDQSKQDQSKQDQSKQDQSKQDQSKQDQSKQDQSKHDRRRVWTNAKVTKLSKAVRGGFDLQVCTTKRALPIKSGSGCVQVHARIVVLATPINVLKTLVPPELFNKSKLVHVKSQPWVRAYVKVAKQSRQAVAEAVQKYKVVYPNVLMKIREVDAAAGVYMAAYADGPAALQLHKDHTLLRLQRLLTAALGFDVKLTAHKLFYHKHGTHYFTPHIRLTLAGATATPDPNLHVVGEAVAAQQGWTEGALQSVEYVVKRLLTSSARPTVKFSI
jgi:monoamine oxidase